VKPGPENPPVAVAVGLDTAGAVIEGSDKPGMPGTDGIVGAAMPVVAAKRAVSVAIAALFCMVAAVF
jgi:hypothetical protein